MIRLCKESAGAADNPSVASLERVRDARGEQVLQALGALVVDRVFDIEGFRHDCFGKHTRESTGSRLAE